jgi:glycosyltransferase involved in cell wall biosynthesis
MSEIKISVVMSVYNSEKYIREAVESILNQTFTDFEFIIVNDGSTDNSLKIIKSYKDERIVIISQNNAGLPKALNTGIDKSKSNIIARMDADDISLPERLERQYDFLVRNPGCIIVGSNAMLIDMNGNYIYTTSNKLSDKEIKKGLPDTSLLHPSVMFKKNIFYLAGKYCESMMKGQDYVLFNRMAKFGEFYNIKDPLIKYRVVPTANSVKKKLGKRYLMIQQSAIRNNSISESDQIFLKSILKNRTSEDRLAKYFIYLAKKYLWNNYQPRLARKNLLLSYKINFSFYVIVLFALTFFPKDFIKKLYTGLKNLQYS